MTTVEMPGRPARTRRLRPSSMIVVTLLSTSFALGTPNLAWAQDPAMPPMSERPPEQPVPPQPPPNVVAPPVVPLPPPPPTYLLPPQAPTPSLARPTAETRPSHVPAYLIWAAAGASLVVGAAFGIAAISAKTDFDDRSTFERADAVHSRAVKADVGLGLGLILAVTGTVFFFSGGRPESGGSALANGSARSTRALERLRIDPMVGHAAGGGALTMRF